MAHRKLKLHTHTHKHFDAHLSSLTLGRQSLYLASQGFKKTQKQQQQKTQVRRIFHYECQESARLTCTQNIQD